MSVTDTARNPQPRLLPLLAAVLLTVVGTLTPQPASADPTELMLDVPRLQALIDAAPPAGVRGQLLTVTGGGADSQQKPVSLPLNVLSVVPGAGPAGDLILVRLDLNHPVLAALGSIAAGMSGSPVYVRVGGQDKLIGALSYGEAFTTGGLGLATPIHAMTAVEKAGLNASASSSSGANVRKPFSGRVVAVDPFAVDGHTVTRIVVDAPSTSAAATAKAKAAAEADPSTVHFRPLTTMRIGGLPVGSSAYRRLSATLAQRGHSVLEPLAAGSAGATDNNFAATLEPGAALGAFYALGGITVGSVGTVTYTTSTGGVIGFGHPIDWNGATSMLLANARIAGIWSSAATSYTIATPGAVRGAVLQDRAAGIGGRVGAEAVSFPVTASARVVAGGRADEVSSPTRVASRALSIYGTDLIAAAVAAPAYRAADAAQLPGTSDSRISVTVTDSAGADHTVSRQSRNSDTDDVLDNAPYEVSNIVSTLLEGRRDTVSVKSIAVSSEIDTNGPVATIDGVRSSGLVAGRNNPVTVLVRPRGAAAPVPVTVRLQLPAGMSPEGNISVRPGEAVVPEPKDQSLPALVASLSNALDSSYLVVDFESDESSTRVRGVVRTKYALSGWAEASSSEATLEASAKTVTAGQAVRLTGTVSEASSGDTVTVQRRTRGSSVWTTVRARVPLTVGDDEDDDEDEESVQAQGEGEFSLSDRPQHNSVYRVLYAGSADTLGSQAQVVVGVRGKVAMSGAATTTGFRLVAAVTPKAAGHRITFQQLVGGKWWAIRSVPTAANGRAVYAWTVGKGKRQVRATLGATPVLAGNVTGTITLSR